MTIPRFTTALLVDCIYLHSLQAASDSLMSAAIASSGNPFASPIDLRSQHCAKLMLGCLHDLLVDLRHFLICQRAVLGLIRERVSQALFPRRNRIAPVYVEQLDLAQ